MYISLFRCLNSELWDIKKESVSDLYADWSWSALSSLGWRCSCGLGRTQRWSGASLMDVSLRFTSAWGMISHQQHLLRNSDTQSLDKYISGYWMNEWFTIIYSPSWFFCYTLLNMNYNLNSYDSVVYFHYKSLSLMFFFLIDFTLKKYLFLFFISYLSI